MLNLIFGYLFLLFGLLMLVLPLILVELSRPRDWLIGGLFLILGLFLFVENDFLRGSINLLIISTVILNSVMMFEIIQYRWYQLSVSEKKRIGSFDRWFESFRQVGQIFTLLGIDGEMFISPQSWSDLSGSIPWEVLCGFRNRLPRVLV